MKPLQKPCTINVAQRWIKKIVISQNYKNINDCHHQSQTSAQVVETVSDVTANSPSQGYTRLDDHT